jgi:hypothetical protein
MIPFRIPYAGVLYETVQHLTNAASSATTILPSDIYSEFIWLAMLLQTDSGPIADGVEAALRAVINLIAQLIAFPLAVALGVIRWALRTPLPPEAPGIASTPGATSSLSAYTPYFTDLQGFFERLALAAILLYAVWYAINIGLDRYNSQGLGELLVLFAFGVAAITVSGEIIGIFYEFIDAFVYALLGEDPNELATDLASASLEPEFASDPDSVGEVAAYAGLTGSSLASEALLAAFVGGAFQFVSALVSLVLVLYLVMRIIALHALYAAAPLVIAIYTLQQGPAKVLAGPADKFISITVSMAVGVIPIVIVLKAGLVLAEALATQVPAGGYFFSTAAITGASWLSLKTTDTTRRLAGKVKSGAVVAGTLAGVGAVGGSLSSVARGAMFRGKRGATIQGASQAGQVAAAKYEKEDFPSPLGDIFERVTSTPGDFDDDTEGDGQAMVTDNGDQPSTDEEDTEGTDGVSPFQSDSSDGASAQKPTALSKLENSDNNELAEEWKDANPGEEALVDDEDPAAKRKEELQKEALKEAANRGELEEVDEYMQESDDIEYDGMGNLGFSPQIPSPGPRTPTPDDRNPQVPQQNASRPTSTAATDGVDYSSAYRDESPGTDTGDPDISASDLPQSAEPGEGYIDANDTGVAPDEDVFSELTESELDIERQPDDEPGDLVIGGGEDEMEDIESTINRVTEGEANIERADGATSASQAFAVDLGQTDFDDETAFVDAFEDDYVPVAEDSAVVTTASDGDLVFRTSASDKSFKNILDGAVTDPEEIEALGKGKYKVSSDAVDEGTIRKIGAPSPAGQGYDLGLDSSATATIDSPPQSIPAPTARVLDMDTVSSQAPIDAIKRRNSESVAERIDQGEYLVRTTDLPDGAADALPDSATRVNGLDGFVVSSDTLETVQDTFNERNINLQPATEKAQSTLGVSGSEERYEVALGRLGSVGAESDEGVVQYRLNDNNEYEDVVIGAQPDGSAVQLRQLTTQYRGSNGEIKEQTAPATTVDLEQIEPDNPASQTRQAVRRKLSGTDGIRAIRTDSNGNGVQFAAFTDQTDPTHIADVLREEGVEQFEVADNYTAQQIDTGAEAYATQTITTSGGDDEVVGIMPTGDGTAVAEPMPDYRNVGVSVGMSPETGSTTIELTSSGDVDGEPEITRNEFANLLQNTIDDDEFNKAIEEVRAGNRMPAIELQQRENAQRVIKEIVGRAGVGINREDGRRLGVIQEQVDTQQTYTADVSSFIDQSNEPQAVEFTAEGGRISKVEAKDTDVGMRVVDESTDIPGEADALAYRVGNNRDVDAAIQTSGDDVQVVVNEENIDSAMQTFGTDLIETQPEQGQWGTAIANVSKKGNMEATINELISRAANDNRRIQVETGSLKKAGKSLEDIKPAVNVPEGGAMKVAFEDGYPAIEAVSSDRRRDAEVEADLAVRGDGKNDGVEIEFDNTTNAEELRAKIEEELSHKVPGEIVRLDDEPPRTVGVAQSDLEVEDILTAVSDLDVTVAVDEHGVERSMFTQQENPRKQTHDDDIAGKHADGWMLRD